MKKFKVTYIHPVNKTVGAVIVRENGMAAVPYANIILQDGTYVYHGDIVKIEVIFEADEVYDPKEDESANT